MISLNTASLKEALSKVNKCAKNDKTAPLTQLLHIKVVDEHTIEFTTTDEMNTFSYRLTDDVSTFEELDVCVLVDQVSKLVSKFTSPKTDISLSESGNEIKLHGDGTYTLSIPVDTEGTPIKYPQFDVGEPKTDVYTGTVTSIISASKYCDGSITKLSCDIQVEDYPRTNYYVSDKVVSLDGFLVTIVDGEFLPFEMLVSPATMKLLSNFSDSNFKAYKTDKYVVFECDDCKMVTIEPAGLDAYPIEVASQIVDNVKGNRVNVAANVLLNALNRLNLFTEDRYDNSIKIKFNGQGVFAYTINEACVEPISSEAQNDDFECYINVNSLISLIKAYNLDVLTITYGDEQCLKVESGDVRQIIVLSDLVGVE